MNEEVELYIEEMKEEFNKCITHFKNELNSFKAGRANPRVLDKILVDYYGSPTPINQMANIAVSEARILTISVWDVSMVKAVSKAIQTSDIGINPSDDGKVIRLVFPQLTEDRRRELTKQIKATGENAKITLRNARRDCLEGCKKLVKDKIISEDDLATCEKEVQKHLDNSYALIEKGVVDKEKEVMTV